MNVRALVHGAIGAAALLLAGLSIWGTESNRAAAASIEAQRAEYDRVQRIADIDKSLVQLLVKTAVERNDPELRGLLAANGVTFKLNDGAPATTQAPAQGAAK